MSEFEEINFLELYSKFLGYICPDPFLNNRIQI